MIAQTLSPPENKYRTPDRKRMVETGTASPSTEHFDERLNLNEYLVKRPETTFFSRIHGNENISLGLCDGDLLVIDRSLAPRHDSIVMAVLEGEFKVCRLLEQRGEWYAEMGDGRKVFVKDDRNQQFYICGRVTHVIHSCI